MQQDEEGPSLVTGIGNGGVELGMAKTVLRITSEFMVLSQYAADTASEVWSDPPPTSWGGEGKAPRIPRQTLRPGAHISEPPPYRADESPSKPGTGGFFLPPPTAQRAGRGS